MLCRGQHVSSAPVSAGRFMAALPNAPALFALDNAFVDHRASSFWGIPAFSSAPVLSSGSHLVVCCTAVC